VNKANLPEYDYDTIIIGGGPAGYTAGIYAARSGLKTLLVEGAATVSQITITDTIENYPGIPDGINGFDLMQLFKKQALNFGLEIQANDVSSIKKHTSTPFIWDVVVQNKSYSALSVIAATGAQWNKLGVPDEEEFAGKGVSYCATCDGWFFKDKKVAVVGGGDSALEEAIFLTRYASSVTIIHRRDELRAGALLQERAKKNEKINFLWDTIVTEIKGDGGLNQLVLENTKTGEKSEMDVNGLFIFIGHKPNSAMFIGQLEMDENGYLITDTHYRTKLPGVFAAGEIHDSVYKQVVTSAGMGAAAAIQVRKFLENEEDV